MTLLKYSTKVNVVLVINFVKKHERVAYEQILKKSILKPYIHSANFEKSLLKSDLFNFKPSTEETLDQVCEEPYQLKRLFSFALLCL